MLEDFACSRPTEFAIVKHQTCLFQHDKMHSLSCLVGPNAQGFCSDIEFHAEQLAGGYQELPVRHHSDVHFIAIAPSDGLQIPPGR